ncbi:MAG TPA: YciI family protein [Pseudonocardiaceae bacterium]|jgi:uncharacterized protein YciI|nr:YciI family protein [Pseudonocardiaceae bacterium]
MNTYFNRLIPPRPTFAFDMTAAELAIMKEHAAYWKVLAEKGSVVVYGPVDDPAGPWGLGVLLTETEQQARELMDHDPAVSSGMSTYELFPFLSARFGRIPAAEALS